MGYRARCAERGKRRKVAQDAGDETASHPAQARRAIRVISTWPPGAILQAQMNMDAVAKPDFGDDRRERRPATVSPRDIAYDIAHYQCPVGVFEPERRPAVHLILRRSSLGLEGFRLLAGGAQRGDYLGAEIGRQLVGDQRIVGVR